MTAPVAGQTFTVRVTPRASSARVVRETGDDGKAIYRVYVTVPPEGGKANREVIELMAKELGVRKSALEIAHGHTGRDKVVRYLG